MATSPDVLFRAWTENFDQWFAEPGAILMKPEVNAPYFFETLHEGKRHAHYGRFLKVERDRLVELTWLNEAGTHGAETVLTVELSPNGNGTLQRLTHSGFRDKETSGEHKVAWEWLLQHRLVPLLTKLG